MSLGNCDAFPYGRSRVVIAQDARCCAVTQEERYCRREPLPETPECLGLPWFIQLCPYHANKAVEIQQYQEQKRAKERYEQRLRSAREATVYYVQRADGLVKIGFTARYQQRMSTLRREFGPIQVLATHSGGRDAERAMHIRFAADRVTGEWFRCGPELFAHIERIKARRADSDREGAA